LFDYINFKLTCFTCFGTRIRR